MMSSCKWCKCEISNCSNWNEKLWKWFCYCMNWVVKMWFRPRSSQSNENDRSRVSSFRNRIRSKKSSAASDKDKESNAAAIKKPITVTPNRLRDGDSGSVGYVLRSQSGRRLSLLSASGDDEDGAKERNRTLRVDQKYKKNRVSKSSSRTKVVPVPPPPPDVTIKPDKQNAGKSLNGSNNNNNQRKVSTPLIDTSSTSPVKGKPAKTTRRNTTLNLNALLRYKSFISGSTKKLTSDDFERLRRKSLGDTGKIHRRKSNTTSDDGDKVVNTTKSELKQQHQSSFECDKLSDDDFHSCSEDQAQSQHEDYDSIGALSFQKLALNKLDRGYDYLMNSTASAAKKTKLKNKKKGFYRPQIQTHFQWMFNEFSICAELVSRINRFTYFYFEQKYQMSKINQFALMFFIFLSFIIADRPSQASVVRQPSDRRLDPNNSLNSTIQSSHHPTHHHPNELNTSHSIDNDTSIHDNTDNRESRDRWDALHALLTKINFRAKKKCNRKSTFPFFACSFVRQPAKCSRTLELSNVLSKVIEPTQLIGTFQWFLRYLFSLFSFFFHWIDLILCFHLQHQIEISARISESLWIVQRTTIPQTKPSKQSPKDIRPEFIIEIQVSASFLLVLVLGFGVFFYSIYFKQLRFWSSLNCEQKETNNRKPFCIYWVNEQPFKQCIFAGELVQFSKGIHRCTISPHNLSISMESVCVAFCKLNQFNQWTIYVYLSHMIDGIVAASPCYSLRYTRQMLFDSFHRSLSSSTSVVSGKNCCFSVSNKLA